MARRPSNTPRNISLQMISTNRNVNTWITPHDMSMMNDFGGNGNVDSQVQNSYNMN